MIRIEYQPSLERNQWNCYATTTQEGWALVMLALCRQNHPDRECRIRNGHSISLDFTDVA